MTGVKASWYPLHMVKGQDRVGKELPKEYREIATELVNRQGWGYRLQGKGHPMLFPADPTKRPIAVPTTPGDRRSLANFVAVVRRSDGQWPV